MTLTLLQFVICEQFCNNFSGLVFLVGCIIWHFCLFEAKENFTKDMLNFVRQKGMSKKGSRMKSAAKGSKGDHT